MDEDAPYDPDPADEDDGEDTSQGVALRGHAVRQRVLQRRPVVTKKPQTVGRGGKRILAKQKQRQALELRKAGATYQAIADAVGYNDQSAARKAVQRAFQDVIQEPVMELKTMQVERLNHMLMVLWPKVQQGDERAIQTSLSVMDKIDRLMGTDAAQQVDVNVNQQNAILVVDGSKDDYVRALKQMAGINHDGTNVQHALGPATQPPSGIVDGEVVDDRPLSETLTSEDIDTIHRIMAPPEHDPQPMPYVPVVGPSDAPTPDPPKKKFDFSVKPKTDER